MFIPLSLFYYNISTGKIVKETTAEPKLVFKCNPNNVMGWGDY